MDVINSFGNFLNPNEESKGSNRDYRDGTVEQNTKMSLKKKSRIPVISVDEADFLV